MKRYRAQLSLVLITVIWGYSFIVLSKGIADLAPETLLFWRFFIAGATLFLVRILRGKKGKLPWKEGFIGGTLFGIAFFCQTKGMLYTTPSVAAFLTGLLVVFTPLFEGLLSKKIPRIKVWLSSCSALLGTYLLIGGNGGSQPIGVLLQILCAIFFALHVVYIGNQAHLESIDFVAVQCLLMTLFFGIYAFFNQTMVFPNRNFTEVLYLGVLASALGLLVQVKAQKVISPSRASLIFALEPVFTALFSALVFSEKLGAKSIIGMLFIFIASIDFSLRADLGVLVKKESGS